MNEYTEPTGRWLRKMRLREERVFNTAIIVILALTAIYLCWLGWMKARQPDLERAAYLEGRYGLDHDTETSYSTRFSFNLSL